MSTTVTETEGSLSPSVVRLLADYELHHSGDESTASPQSETAAQHEVESENHVENPAWWPTDHRRVPPYRPINRELDISQRPNGRNPMETWFISTMLGGVTINAHAAVLWGSTGGKVFDHVFRYPIGGER